jgi:hypothetical protein
MDDVLGDYLFRASYVPDKLILKPFKALLDTGYEAELLGARSMLGRFRCEV